MSDIWAEYFRWNDAVAEEYFSGRFHDAPVFLNLEEEPLGRLARRMGIPIERAAAALTAAVVSTLNLPPSHAATFAEHRHAVRRWKAQGSSDAPPCLGLLALFSLAAESMVGDENFRPNNYRGRLCEQLGVNDPADRRRFNSHFTRDSGEFWAALNTWLDDAHGKRGLSTAHPFDWRRHVGLPISQALIREHDRRHLPTMFELFGLQPNQRISVSDMKPYLAEWLATSGVSHALRRLWDSPSNRDRIAETACIELEGWDGRTASVSRESKGVSEARIQLVAQLNLQPRPRIILAPMVGAGHEIPEGAYCSTADAAASPISGIVSLEPVPGTAWRAIKPQDSVNLTNLLLSHVKLRAAESSAILSRGPRRLVILRWMPEEGLFVERSKAELLETYVLLSHVSFSSEVRDALHGVAREGFAELTAEQLAGLPAHWVAFRNVQIERSLETDNDDLSMLRPHNRAQLSIGGGLNLPGRQTWHKNGAPEIRAACLENLTVRLTIESLDGSSDALPQESELAQFTGSTAVSLAGRGLVEGDYRVTLKQAGLKGPKALLASARLRLRSATRPAQVSEESLRLVHDLMNEDRLGALSAQPTDVVSEGAARLQGAHLEVGREPASAARPDGSVEIPSLPCGTGLAEEADGDIAPRIAPGASVTPADCITGGAHYRICPPLEAGATRSQLPRRSECRDCGLEAWHERRRVRPRRRTAASRPDVATLPPESSKAPAISAPGALSPTDVLDALSYARVGKWAAFERLVSTEESTPWQPLETARSLSGLGHIDFWLDARSLRPKSWSVSPTTLAILENGDAILCGARSELLLDRLREDVSALGGSLHVECQPDGPDLVTINALDAREIDDVASSSSSALREPIRVSLAPGRRIAQLLPKLSQLMAHLPEHALSSSQLERFDLHSSKWFVVPEAIKPGAYRLSELPRVYGVLSDQGSLARLHVADARTVKHLAAGYAGLGLIGYDEERRALIAPLGAELPGLYHRAAILCSGLLPRRRTDGLVEYPSVPSDVAEILWQKLSSAAQDPKEASTHGATQPSRDL